MEVLLYTILTLCALGVLSAVILYFVAQKFRVEEDPRIDEVEKMLPGANCGGCGYAGCSNPAGPLVFRAAPWGAVLTEFADADIIIRGIIFGWKRNRP